MNSVHHNNDGMVIVIMGVCGAGKSTVGAMLAKQMNLTFLDADDFHPISNKEKMSKGVPLSDEDRIPWLEKIRDALKESIACRNCVVLGCSALQKSYREILRSSDPKFKLGNSPQSCIVKFVLLDAPAEVIASRLERRAREGKHFMASTLLKSQLDLLEIDDSEGVLKVDAARNPQVIVNDIHELLLVQRHIMENHN